MEKFNEGDRVVVTDVTDNRRGEKGTIKSFYDAIGGPAARVMWDGDDAGDPYQGILLEYLGLDTPQDATAIDKDIEELIALRDLAAKHGYTLVRK